MRRPSLDRTIDRLRPDRRAPRSLGRTAGVILALAAMVAGFSRAPSVVRAQQAPSLNTTGANPDTLYGARLTLAEAVARARENYPGLAAARAGEAAAAAAVGQATSKWWPQLALQASLTQFEEPMLVAPLHGFDITAAPEFDETLIRGDVSFGWTLYDGGARGARIRRARAGAAGAASARAAAEQGLVARVARVYLEVLTAQGVLDAQDRRIAALEAERGRVQQFLDEGRAAQVELLRVDAALADARAGRVATTARLDLSERELARLMGVAADSVRVRQLVPVELTRDSLEDRSTLVERARRVNPELERARQDVVAAEAGRRAALAAWIPEIGLFGVYQGFSGGDELTAEWQAGVSVSYPVFTGGERSSAIRAAGAEAERVREELRLAELETADRVDAALNAVLESRARVRAVAEVVRHQSEVVRIELLSLEAGAGTQTDYLRAEADLLRVRSALVEARHAEIAARVELARVTGELTGEWLNENVEIVP